MILSRRTLLAALALTLPLWAGPPVMAAEPADTVLRNGAIYTMDAKHPWVQALAMRKGKVVSLGKDGQMGRYIGPKTQLVDLQGAMAMPGLNDVHAHPLDGAYEDLYTCNFAPQSNFDQILQRIAAAVKQAEPGDWIVGGGWSVQLLSKLSTSEALAALDKVSQGHPVFLRDDTYHNRWVNSVVLNLANLTPASPEPPGGVFMKDGKTGALTGVLKEFSAFAGIEQKMPPRPLDRQMKAAKAAMSTLNAFGITAVQDAFDSEPYLDIWTRVEKESGLKVWLVASLSAMPAKAPGERTGLDLLAIREQFRTAHIRPDFAKLFLDGVPPARTAEFLEPYLPDAEHGAGFRGASNYTLPQLTDLLTELDRRGIGVKMHATGDGSVRLALDAIAAARARNGARGPQHHIAHASFIAPVDLPRFKQLNTVADISPMLWFPTGAGFAIAGAIGQARAEHFFPVKSLLRAGALVAAGSDWPAGQPTPDPWIGMEGLITRKNPLKEIPGALWPEEAVDLATALRIYTVNSSRAMGLEKITGSLEVGKSADLIVLDRNLFQIPAEQIHETKVRRTYFQGKLVYSAK